MSSGLSGRLIQPCTECGALLKLSAMRLLSLCGALALIGTSMAMFVYGPSPLWLALALVCALTILAGVLGTRVEALPSRRDVELPGHPDAQRL